MSVAPYFRCGGGIVGKRIVGRDRTVVVDPDNLPEMAAPVLGLLADEFVPEFDRRVAAIANGCQQRAVRQPDQTGAKVLSSGFGLGHFKNDLPIAQGTAIKGRSGDAGGRLAELVPWE